VHLLSTTAYTQSTAITNMRCSPKVHQDQLEPVAQHQDQLDPVTKPMSGSAPYTTSCPKVLQDQLDPTTEPKSDSATTHDVKVSWTPLPSP
jgi:hypothetical protein